MINMKDVNAFVKLDDGTKEFIPNCNATVTLGDDFSSQLYLKLERDDSVSYFDMDRVVSFTFKKASS